MESLIPTRTPAYFQLNSFEFSDDTRHVLLIDIMRSFRPWTRFIQLLQGSKTADVAASAAVVMACIAGLVLWGMANAYPSLVMIR